MDKSRQIEIPGGVKSEPQPVTYMNFLIQARNAELMEERDRLRRQSPSPGAAQRILEIEKRLKEVRPS